MITIRAFIQEAKAILARDCSLAQKQDAIGAGLAELCKRDDLTRFGLPIGPTDACTSTYVLWREPPHLGLVLAGFDPGYVSPVHEHGDFWVVGSTWRGSDRWDMYERLDDGSQPGHSQLRMVGQQFLPPGKWAVMPPPPRAIHSHNNTGDGQTLELLFSVNKPLLGNTRLVYDVEGNACWPSGFNLGPIYIGDRYPAAPAAALAQRIAAGTHRLRDGLAGWRRQRWSCPACVALQP